MTKVMYRAARAAKNTLWRQAIKITFWWQAIKNTCWWRAIKITFWWRAIKNTFWWGAIKALEEVPGGAFTHPLPKGWCRNKTSVQLITSLSSSFASLRNRGRPEHFESSTRFLFSAVDDFEKS